MRILIGFLVGALLIGALVWSGWEFDHPIWGPWQPQQAEIVSVECNGQWFEMPKPAQGSFYECENGLPALVTPIRHMPAGQPTATPDVQPTPPAPCTVIHDYQLKDLPEVATNGGNFMHIEYWVGGDAPEYETILAGGRYLLRINFAGGHVWEYGPGCNFYQVMEQVNAHIANRIAQKANNGGYVNWEQTGYFIPVR